MTLCDGDNVSDAILEIAARIQVVPDRKRIEEGLTNNTYVI